MSKTSVEGMAVNPKSAFVEETKQKVVRQHISYRTLFEISIFCPKIQLWFPEKNYRIVLGENSWKCCGFGLFSCWQLWFHEKNCQKSFGWKTCENVGDLHFLVVGNFDFPRKLWSFVKIEFLDKNLTFRIVCALLHLVYKL